jgi:hypothetical protein
MDFLKNIAIRLRATGPAAVLVSWVLDVTALGIWGNAELGRQALTTLSVVGGLLIVILGQRA